MGKKYLIEVLLVTLVAVIAVLADGALAQAPFYHGKTLVIVLGTAPGGAGDHRTRALVPSLRKYIPGNPTIVLEHRAGGGGRQAANHVYQVAKPDGLTIGALSGSIVALNVLGATGVMYDIDKFIYLGASESTSHQILYTRKELALSNSEKLRAASGFRIGAQAVGHSNYIAGRLFAYFLGLKEPKFIVGYTTPEIEVALLRGELDGRANNVAQLLHRNPDWVEKSVMDIHAILEIPKGAKHPRFGRVREIESFAKSENEAKLLAMYRTLRLVGVPYALPPGTPKDKVMILQDATRKAFKDADFHREYKKLTGEEPDPLMPEEMEKAIREMPRDAEVTDLLKKTFCRGPASCAITAKTAYEVWLRVVARVKFLRSSSQRLESGTGPSPMQDLTLVALPRARTPEKYSARSYTKAAH